MTAKLRPIWPLLALTVFAACASPYERGEKLYRQGDLRSALEVWRGIDAEHRDYEKTSERLQVIDAEFERMLRRYEKRASFFESEGRLAEAVLYYRLTTKLDPARRPLLDRAQVLVRELDQKRTVERSNLTLALDEGRLHEASRHAEYLEKLDPFNPAIQIEIRQVQHAVGAEVLRHLEEGKRAYAAGRRIRARTSFESVLRLDSRNEVALGYLSYIRRFDQMEAKRRIPPPPRSISQEEILAEGHFRSGQDAEDAGEPFWAITEYQAALRINPTHRPARDRLHSLRSNLSPQVEELYESGKRYFQDEDLHNALRLWRRVLLIDPRHSRTKENVERAEKILSRLEEIQTGGS